MIYASGFAGGGVIAGIRLGLLLEIAAIWMRLLLCSPTDSRKTDFLWKHRRHHRDDYRRGNGRRDLQTRAVAKLFAVI
jgi:hypothetical protein